MIVITSFKPSSDRHLPQLPSSVSHQFSSPVGHLVCGLVFVLRSCSSVGHLVCGQVMSMIRSATHLTRATWILPASADPKPSGEAWPWRGRCRRREVPHPRPPGTSRRCQGGGESACAYACPPRSRGSLPSRSDGRGAPRRTRRRYFADSRHFFTHESVRRGIRQPIRTLR